MLANISRKVRAIFSYLIIVPLLIGVSVATLSLWVMVVAADGLEAATNQTIDKRLQENKIRLSSSLKSYAELAHSGVARVNSAPIDSRSWAMFVDSYDLKNDYQGVFSFGISKVVGNERVDEFTQQTSNDYGREISIFPLSNSALKAPLAYLQPRTTPTDSSIGFDLYSEPRQKDAMERSAKSGKVVISDSLSLLQNPTVLEKNPTNSFLMYEPYYIPGSDNATEGQRLASVKGYVFVAIDVKNVFRSFFESTDMTRTGVTVFTNDQRIENKLYSSKATRQNGPVTTMSQAIKLYGQTFVVRYDFDTESLVSQAQSTTPMAILISGLTLALMLSAVTYLSLHSRHNKLLFEKEREIKIAKDKLLSLASHQLRTPATGVKQYMGMVLQGFAGNITPQQKDFLEKAYESNDRQLRVINDILHLAKLDAGHIVLSKRDFDIALLIRDVADEQQLEADRADIVMTIKSPKKAMYRGDSHMLRMVIENLISNAIKYSPNGSKIAISLKKKKLAYEIHFIDNGVGIDRDDFPKLFKQFSRIDNVRSHMVSGTGVGLYLADNLTKLHGGEIIVNSKPGYGSTFKVVLPLNM